MNRGRKEIVENVVLVTASLILTLFIILGSGRMTADFAAHWTERTVAEGEKL